MSVNLQVGKVYKGNGGLVVKVLEKCIYRDQDPDSPQMFKCIVLADNHPQNVGVTTTWRWDGNFSQYHAMDEHRLTKEIRE